MDKIREEFEKEFDIPDFLEFDGEDYMYYGEDPLLVEQCESTQDHWRGYKAGCKSRDEEIKRAYDYLSACGVPKERARTIHNGIDVLATRFRKEINLDAGEKTMLREEIKKLKGEIQEWSVSCGIFRKGRDNYQAEIKKLRDALEYNNKIAKEHKGINVNRQDWINAGAFRDIVKSCDKALKDKK